MSCTGIVRGRRVEFDGEVDLPEGTRVRVIPEEVPGAEISDKSANLVNWLRRAHEGRARRPATRDSTDLLRELREERAGR